MGIDPVRPAERARIWSTLQKAPNREVQLLSFSFTGIPGIRDGVLKFRSPITAICGINGTGKSSLLRAIWATLNWSEIDDRPEIRERLKAFSAELQLEIEGQKITLKPQSQVQPTPIKVLHIDPSTTVGQFQRTVCEINVLEELVESHAPIELEQEDVALLNVILNKSYDTASIYEIDDYEEETPFPFISVTETGESYDLRTMSLGEISVFWVFWALYRAPKKFTSSPRRTRNLSLPNISRCISRLLSCGLC
jgi:AAA domain-containing protein